MRAIVPAAGKGRRLHAEASDLPKVLHRACGRPLLETVLEQLDFIDKKDIYIVDGYQKDKVIDYFGDAYHYVEQTEQLGTGHAVMCAADQLGDTGETLILCGDTPLVTADTLKMLCGKHREAKNGVTVLSAVLEDAGSYGRIIRDAEGNFLRITEAKDCTEEEKLTKEINSGMYLFDTAMLKESLGKLDNNNAQGEYYLTDTIALIKEAGGRVDAVPVSDITEIMGVNTKAQLAEAEKIMASR